ncbi:MAG: cytidine deaminase [Saprospiraceae bacterium]|nr:cytidine deaminase [Saprospiraceae bacterium]
MDVKQFSFSYGTYDDQDFLTGGDRLLLAESVRACAKAYAPYSNFKVGVAIRTEDGQIIIGSNQENGAFPIGQCAERVALYAMVHQHGRKPIDTIAISVDNENQLTPASPCGSCRQMLNEYRSYQTNPIRLLLSLSSGGVVYEINDVKDLLPFAFDGSFLGQ